MNDPNMLVLNSMHKYEPRVHIVECDNLADLMYKQFSTYRFSNTQFIVVTAYQNSQVTKLKIEHNPFAKGFRERASKRGFGQNNGNPKPKKRPKSLSPDQPSHYFQERSPDVSPNDSLETGYGSGLAESGQDIICPVPIQPDPIVFKTEFNPMEYYPYQQQVTSEQVLGEYGNYANYNQNFDRIAYAQNMTEQVQFEPQEYLLYEQ